MRASDSGKFFLHSSVEVSDDFFMIASTTRRNEVIIIPQFRNLPSDIFCKIPMSIPSVFMSLISPSFMEILCISTEKMYTVLSIKEFTEFVQPSKIPGFSESKSFPLDEILINVNKKDRIAAATIQQETQYPIISAFWWQVDDKNMYYVLIQTMSIVIMPLIGTTPVKTIPVSEVYASSHKIRKNKCTIFLYQKTTSIMMKMKHSSEGFHFGTQTINTTLEPSIPIISQFSQIKNSKWSFMLLNQSLVFFDKPNSALPMTDFVTDSQKSQVLVVTQNFLFDSSNGSLSVRFLKRSRIPPVEIAHNVISVSIVNPETDTVIITTNTTLIVFSIRHDFDLILRNLLIQRQLYDASLLCEGFSINIQDKFSKFARDFIKNNEFHIAVEILVFAKCDIKQFLQRLLSHGKERFALQLLLSGNKGQFPIEKRETLFLLFLQKIYKKMLMFPRISNIYRYNYSFGIILKPCNLLSAEEKALIRSHDSKLKSIYPSALLFRYQMELMIESIEFLGSSSSIDIPYSLSHHFSPSYSSLLRCLKQIKPNNIGDMDLPICSSIIPYKNGYAYLSKGQVYINEKSVSQTEKMIQFCIFKEYIYSIDSSFLVYRTDLSKLELEPLFDIPHSIFMEAINSRCVFLTVSGSIVCIDHSGNISTYEGTYVDFALSETCLFALDEIAEVYSLSNGDSVKYNCSNVVKSVLMAENTLLLITIDNSIIINENIIQLDFTPEVMKSGPKAIIGRSGILWLISPNGLIDKLYFPERCGTILDILILKDSYIIVGTAGSPMIIRENIPNDVLPGYSEIYTISKAYPFDKIYNIIECDVVRMLLCILHREWKTLDNYFQFNLINSYINSMDDDIRDDYIDYLVKREIYIDPAILSNPLVRCSIMKNRSNLHKLDIGQLKKLLLPDFTLKNIFDVETPLKLLQKRTSSVIIQSLQLSEGQLYVFSCGHVMNQTSFDESLYSLEHSFNQKKLINSYHEVLNEYKCTKIRAQCPLCLKSAVEKK